MQTFPLSAPGHQAITVTPALLLDLLNTARNLCPQCYASGEHMQVQSTTERGSFCRCVSCGYQGPEGDWRVGWLCRTLREAVAHMLAMAQGNAQAPQDIMPVNIGRNNSAEDAPQGTRMLRRETVMLCRHHIHTGEHVWHQGLGYGKEYCMCGAQRNVHTQVPHAHMPYAKGEGNVHNTQGEGNIPDTRVQQSTGTLPLPPYSPAVDM